MKKNLRFISSSVGAAGTFLIGTVHAAVPTEVTTAMTDMKADGIAVATAFLVATIAITAFLFMKRGAK
jgi:hypothetical protein